MPMAVRYTTVDGQIVCENRGGIKTLFMPDTLGNVIETRNMDTGAQTSSTTYWPYGEVRTQTGTNPSPFGFCGVWGYYTQAGQPTYVRARYYRPNLGRWQTVDPLWPEELAYEYCSGSPALVSDAFGLSGASPSRRKRCDALHLDCVNCLSYICDKLNALADKLDRPNQAMLAVIGILVRGGLPGAVVGQIVGTICDDLLNEKIKRGCEDGLKNCNKFKADCNMYGDVFCDALATKRCRSKPDAEREECLKQERRKCRAENPSTGGTHWFPGFVYTNCPGLFPDMIGK